MWGTTRAIFSGNLKKCAIISSSNITSKTTLKPVMNVKHTTRQFVVSSQHSSSPKRGFLQNFIDNLKQEYSKNQELKENINKFRQEAKDLEDSEALRKARKKFEDISKETGQSSDVVKETFKRVQQKVSEAGEEIGKTEFVKQASRITDTIGDAAKQAADSEAFKKVATGLDSIAKGSGVPPSTLYRPPKTLRMRNDFPSKKSAEDIVANEEATGVVMHKDSVWNQQWENFKNSKVGERLSDLKIKYDESDNAVVRASRFLTEKLTDFAGGVFGKTDVSEIMTEISRLEPNFSAQNFIQFCQRDLIPNVLEALSQRNKEILHDWCAEAPYNQLLFPITQAEQLGFVYESKVVDLDHVDIAAGTKVEQGPVLVVSFQTQQIIVVRNAKGDVVEGNADQVMRVYHVWALCRDPEEMNPRAAWKIIDQSMSASPMLL